MTRPLTTPSVAVFESTTRCNLRCTHCGLSCQEQANKRELNTNQAHETIIKLAEFKVKHLVISGGEFTLRDDWLELTQLALGLFETVRIITNGRLGAMIGESLRNVPSIAPLTISVSIDGMESAHDERRGVGSFTLAREALRSIPEITKSVITTVTQENFQELRGLLHLCLEMKVSTWSIQLGLPAGRMTRQDFLTRADRSALADFIWCAQKIGREHGLAVLTDDCSLYQHPMRADRPWTGCPAGYDLVTVLASGAVTGCPTMGMDLVCGNLLIDDIDAVWFSRAFDELRKRPTTCAQCQKCPGGCQAVAKIFGHQLCQ